MNPTPTRRGAIAAMAAAVVPAAVLATSSPAAARPMVTVWHQLQRRAGQLSYRQTVERVGAPPSRRELDRQVRQLTQLVADLTDALVDAHTTAEPRR